MNNVFVLTLPVRYYYRELYYSSDNSEQTFY